ncbi:MAG TPA: ketoacyl-ACP synthase III [Salinivirgaceae bacterium]|nr:ketoacyl-ACP synthase III [Salinivirgaceae bacterium]
MANIQFRGVGISSMAGAVPKRVIKNLEYTQHFPADQVKEIVEKTGIYERRFTDENTTSSDLCYAAAEKLFSDNNIDRNEIDLLLFISQTPDYRMPATSFLLQDRLKLSSNTIALDINLGCSAFIYGLSVAYSLMQQSNLRKALVLDGETRSKVYSPKDRNTAFLFGDAGVAALIERNEKYGDSWFSMNSDGSRHDLIMIPAGGYRKISSKETVTEKVVDEYGNIRSEEHGYMNGADVFNFVIREVPNDFKNILQFSQKSVDQIDYFVFHQANIYMNNYLVKKLKLDPQKVPSTISKFGNTSSVSVPITIISELRDKIDQPKTLLLSAFGVGMSWASAVLTLNECKISEIVEV